MILAAEDRGSSGPSLDNRVCAMSTNVVESVDVAVAVSCQEEGKVRDGKGKKVTRFGKSTGMCE